MLIVPYEERLATDSCCKCGGGDRFANTTDVLQSWRMVVYGHVGAGGESDNLLFIPESSCAFANDTCPEQTQFNHICDDNLLNEECVGGDCFDCDACQAFNYDCTKCVEAGCNYCPGDGICMSVKLETSFWELHPKKITTCPNP